MKLLKIFVLLIALVVGASVYIGYTTDFTYTQEQTKAREKIKNNQNKKPVVNNTIASKKIDENKENLDPLNIYFCGEEYYYDNDIRTYLASTKLGIYSKMEDNSHDKVNDYTFYYILKSNDKIVYTCHYAYDKRLPGDYKSVLHCKKGEGYDDFIKGDTEMYRDYVMPEANDKIDMFVYVNDDKYYKNHFSLGKYSDMKCTFDGTNIYFTYYWYQDTENGPVLVYASNATNTTTTYGKRYNQYIWDTYDASTSNIDIIPYKSFAREHDYYEDYKEYERVQSSARNQKHLEEDIEIYCKCLSADDLYENFPEEFDESWEEAYDFYERYCE